MLHFNLLVMDFSLLARIGLRLDPSRYINKVAAELCKLLILGGSNYDVQPDQLAVTDRRVKGSDLKGW